MFAKFNLKYTILGLVGILVVVLAVVFSRQNYNQVSCQHIEIQLNTKAEGNFITKKVVENLLNTDQKEPILGSKFSVLDLAKLERKVLKNKLVKSCQISRSLNGTLLVTVEEQNPIARIVPYQQNGDSFEGIYLDDIGSFFPLSKEYTKRVMLISGDYLVGKKNLKKKSDQPILELINHINADDFWRTNCSQIIIDRQGYIEFLPLIGSYTVALGKPDMAKVEGQLEKLKIFYQYIDPSIAAQYKKIAVNYTGQIVCTKRDSSLLN